MVLAHGSSKLFNLVSDLGSWQWAMHGQRADGWVGVGGVHEQAHGSVHGEGCEGAMCALF